MSDVKTILCPVALGDRDEEVLSWALDEAQLRDARITLLHAAEPLNPTAKMLIESLEDERINKIQEEVLSDAEAIARKRLEHFCTDHMCLDLAGDSRISEILVVRGRPEQVIISEAERIKPDLLVIGAHSRSIIGEVLLGSVTHKVLQKTSAPVLVVKF